MPSRIPPLVAALVLVACADGPVVAPPLPVAAVHDVGAFTSPPTVVLDQLDSPRGLEFGPDGALYVAEAGNLTINGPCFQTPRGPSCYSGTGAVTRLKHGVRKRVVSGLPSVASPVTGEIAGPQDVGFLGRGHAVVSIGLGSAPTARGAFGPAGSALGHLVRLTPNGKWTTVADISGIEGALNPAGGAIESNPYGLLIEPSRTFVTDAGGNSLVSVRANGTTTVVATFAPTPAPPPFNQSESVPTEVVRGPDGALYVSMLTGAPFVAGAAAIHRVDRSGASTPFAGGFKMVIDFAFDRCGSLYVLEYDTAPLFFGGPGRLTVIRRDGTRSVISASLANPTGLTIGPDGALYVSNKGNRAGVGEVLRFDP